MKKLQPNRETVQHRESHVTARLNSGIAKQSTNYDGGEAPLGSAIRKLPWFKSHSSSVEDSLTEVTELKKTRSVVFDGGQSRSWGFLRQS